MVRLEITSQQGSTLSIALYYPVPDNMYSPLSADLTRTPAGQALTSGEVDLLKQGRLIEVMASYDIANKTTKEAKRALESMWRDQVSRAKDQYKQSYSYAGRTWDGSWN